MRHAVTLEHRDFFFKNRYIEFDGLLSLEQATLLQKEIDETLSQRLVAKSPSCIETFQAGYDLWRENALIKKWAFKNTFAEVAADLLQTHLFRIAFDQYLCPDGIATPLSSPAPLSLLSSAKPLSGAFLICLSGGTIPSSIDTSQCPFPLKEGNVVFFSPQLPISWNLLFQLQHFRWLLVAYAPKQAIYHLENKDPHTHAWKRLGYVFGDSLNDTLHPIVYRD
ncbi:MAG: hypothetical protein K2P51_07835 [Rhabdochlamydiaceae bacterium]|nr:hypothetical protein [Rhabdochlamydiaceae bacterium]